MYAVWRPVFSPCKFAIAGCQHPQRGKAMLLRRARSTFSAAGGVREPKDLHAAWASLAAYDSKAAGTFLNRKADEAKVALNAAGFELAREFVVHGGKAMSFDGTHEVDETDAAYLWLRQADGRTLLTFRGSDTQEDLRHVRNPRTCFMYGHYLHAGVAEREFAPLVGLMSAGDFSSSAELVVCGHLVRVRV